MSAMYGADTDELRALSSTFSSEAERLRRSVASLTGLARQTGWRGTVAERFRSAWNGAHRSRILAVAGDLDSAAEHLRRNAEEQDNASSVQASAAVSIGAGTAGAGARGASLLSLTPRLLGIVNSVAGFADDVKAIYFATMVGLADQAMRFSDAGSRAFTYAAGAKGGFTSAYNGLRGKSGVVVSGAINTLDYAIAVSEHGVGSSEAVASLFEGTLSTAASIVPGGGFVFDLGEAGGDYLYNHTPVGEFLMEGSIAPIHEARIDTYTSAADDALRRGDFEEATRLSSEAMQASNEFNDSANGFNGLVNALNPFH